MGQEMTKKREENKNCWKLEYDHANGNMVEICIISLELIWIPIYRTVRPKSPTWFPSF